MAVLFYCRAQPDRSRINVIEILSNFIPEKEVGFRSGSRKLNVTHGHMITFVPVSLNEMVLAFIRSEYHNFENNGFALSGVDRRIIESPNFDDEEENHRRLWLLCMPLRRGSLLYAVPRDTVWYETELSDHDLDRLLVLRDPYWISPADGNELHLVAKRRPFPLQKEPSDWPSVILWGHTKDGPFTILEGTHRLVAYAGNSAGRTLHASAYVGLSPNKCHWHLPDGI